MTMKHTPGPWAILDDGLGCKEIGRYGGPVASGICVTDGIDPETEDLANARLIAAAPELLEALKNLVGLVQTDILPNIRAIEGGHLQVNTAWRLIAEAHDAIAKAKGGGA